MIRPLVLYFRSRNLPMMVTVMVPATLVVWAGATLPARTFPSLGVAAIALGIAVLSTGLTGEDPRLERTTAVRWPAWRLLHALTVGVLVGAVLLGANLVGGPGLSAAMIVRDCAGLLGAALLAATLLGGQYAWTLPFAGYAVATFSPGSSSAVAHQIAAWPLQPIGTTAAELTAAGLLAAGVLGYVAYGNRR